MGKKSLFEPTIAPEKEEKAPALDDATGHKEAEATAGPPPEPETNPVKEEKDTAPDQNVDGQVTAATGPSSGPEPGAVKTPEDDALSPETDVPLFTADTPAIETDAPPFENDPLVDKNLLLLGVAGVCGLILIILIASIINAGNYYVKQSRGAVEIWKGDFSPVGKDRIMILHGTNWDRPLKKSYSREDVFPFAAVYYLEKASALAEAPVSDDFDRMVYYVDRVQTLFADRQDQETANIINQVRRHIAEARVLQASGEKEAVSLAQEKIKAVSQALTGLIADMAVDAGQEAENEDAGQEAESVEAGQETENVEAGH